MPNDAKRKNFVDKRKLQTNWAARLLRKLGGTVLLQKWVECRMSTSRNRWVDRRLWWLHSRLQLGMDLMLNNSTCGSMNWYPSSNLLSSRLRQNTSLILLMSCTLW